MSVFEPTSSWVQGFYTNFPKDHHQQLNWISEYNAFTSCMQQIVVQLVYPIVTLRLLVLLEPVLKYQYQLLLLNPYCQPELWRNQQRLLQLLFQSPAIKPRASKSRHTRLHLQPHATRAAVWGKTLSRQNKMPFKNQDSSVWSLFLSLFPINQIQSSVLAPRNALSYR